MYGCIRYALILHMNQLGVVLCTFRIPKSENPTVNLPKSLFKTKLSAECDAGPLNATILNVVMLHYSLA